MNQQFKSKIQDVQDFPIKGVLFRDISPLLKSPTDFAAAVDAMVAGLDLKSIDTIVGIESRGFILGAAIAARHGKGFVVARKAGKLPPPVSKFTYKLEYGEATLEMKSGRGRVLIVDDVLATGGTLQATIHLCENAGYQITGVSVLIDLKFLNKFRWNGNPVHSVIQYD